MIGSIIGGVLNVGGAAYGAIAGKRSAKKQGKMIDAHEKRQQAWYDRNYNENVTQRADAQAMINKTRELLHERGQRAAATNTVMGGTDEALALEKEANNQAVADTMQQIHASGEARKDRIEDQHQANQNKIADIRFNMEQNKAQQIQQAASGASAGAAGIVGSILDKKPKQ